MKSTAIICEYNPFHNGHQYHISKIKESSQEDVIIGIMSGNFVQRGEPAFHHKFTRAQMAMAQCDLIVEMPQFFAFSFADDFAYGGIMTAKALNVNTLSFGAENEDFQYLKQQAESLIQQQFNKDAHIMSLRDKKTGFPGLISDESGSNNILGIQYIKNAMLHYPELKFMPVKRIQNDYSEQSLTGEISSATAIRNELKANNRDAFNAMPNTTVQLLEENVSWEDCFPYLKYEVNRMSSHELKEIYTMYEGLENRLKKYINESNTFESFIQKISTKRYTRARLQRLCLYVLLNIKENDRSFYLNDKHIFNHIRVLGMNQKGRAYLKYLKKESSTSFDTVTNRENRQYFELELKCGQLYSLFSNNNKNDFNTSVIITED